MQRARVSLACRLTGRADLRQHFNQSQAELSEFPEASGKRPGASGAIRDCVGPGLNCKRALRSGLMSCMHEGRAAARASDADRSRIPHRSMRSCRPSCTRKRAVESMPGPQSEGSCSTLLSKCRGALTDWEVYGANFKRESGTRCIFFPAEEDSRGGSDVQSTGASRSHNAIPS